MIDTVLNYYLGNIVKNRETNKKYYFSNGKSYNKRQFNVTLITLRNLQTHFNNDKLPSELIDSELSNFLKEISDKKKLAKKVAKEWESKRVERREKKHSNFMNPFKFVTVIPFGKYRGKLICEVDDYPYLKWLIEESSFIL